MSTWTINGTPVTEFESVSYRQLNANAWELQISRPVNGDLPAFWAYDAAITLRDPSNAVRFAGKISRPRRSTESATKRRQLIAMGDAWRDLERQTYMMDYPYDTFSGQTPKVLLWGKWVRVDITDPLNEAEEGAFETVIDLQPQDCSLTLADIASQAGYDAAHRDIQLTGILPPQEADGITLDAALKAGLKWFPGSIAWVEPSTGVLHMRRASSLPTVTIDASRILDYDIIERPDLVLPGASLFVRKKKTSAGGEKEDVTVYTAGDSTALGALAEDVELSPETHVLDIGYLHIEPFGDLNLLDIDWWGKYVPWIKTGRQDATKYVFEAIVNPQVTFGGSVFDTSLSHVIDRGTIKDSWLLYGCAGPVDIRTPFVTTEGMTSAVPKVAPISATCTISFGQKIGSDWVFTSVPVSVPLFLTNFTTTGRYAWEDPVGKVPGEDPSICAGIPALWVGETQALQYQGSITVQYDELPGTLIGNALNITGLDPAWATMAAPIHTAEYDLQRRTVKIEFGSAGYLGLKDLVEQVRAIKHKRPQRQRTTKYGLPPLPSLQSAGQQSNGTPPPAAGTRGQDPLPSPPDLGPFVGVGVKPGTIQIGASTANGTVPDGFNLGNTPPYQIDASGSGYWYAQGEINTSTGAVVGITFHVATSVPSDAGAYAYLPIFSYAPDPDNVDPVTGLALPKVAQLAYGPISFSACWVPYSSPAAFTPKWRTGGGA